MASYLSIIIPTLNEEKFLPHLLKSIKNQALSDYEIIVADAGSTDKTIEIAKSFGCKIVPGGLPAKGRNEGAKIAKGDLFLFLDADTILAKNSLANFLQEFQKRKLDLASFLLAPMGNKKFLRFLYNFFYNFPILVLEKILAHGAGAILVKKEIYQKIGQFDEKIRLAEDHSFLREGAKIGKFGILKSGKIFYSQRRFEKEGFLKTSLCYLLAELYLIFFGPIKSDIFKYKFDSLRKS